MSKKKPLTIQLDVDGVISDFIWGFTRLGAKYGGLPSSTMEQVEWDSFPGLLPSHEQLIWDEISQSNYFWQSLPLLLNPLETQGIRALYRAECQVYFVTNRLGHNVRQQTEAWLLNRLELPSWANPTVIMARSKGEVAKAIMADFSIDDKAENAWCIGWLTTPQNSKTPDCRSYILDRKYNQYDHKIGSSKIRRVPTVQAFLNDIQEKLCG